MIYEIFEDNMPRLEKKLKTISNKCNKYNCVFSYEVKGEKYRNVKTNTGCIIIARFVIIDVVGKAIINDWQFVASLEHTEKGNIIRKITDDEIPQKYYFTDTICEHCNITRRRKHLYIIKNVKTGEYKQVGKSCLKDFTNGLDAESIADYISLFDSLIVGTQPIEGYDAARYIEVQKYLMSVIECVKKFGYVRHNQDTHVYCTAERAFNYYAVWYEIPVNMPDKMRKTCIKEMQSVNFQLDSTENKQTSENALKWIQEKEERTDYIHNLKVICAMEYISTKHIYFLASLIPTYKKVLEAQEKKAKQIQEDIVSEYIGEIKERITIQVKSSQCVTSWDTDYGTIHLYKIKDERGNVFIWKTNKALPEKIDTIVGTVKEHKLYGEIKQTVLTRCNIK